MAKFTKLKALIIEDARIDNSGLERLKGLTEPGGTAIMRCYGVTDAGLASIAGMTKLKKLSLRNLPLTGDGLVNLKAMTALQHLDLNETQVGDAGLAHLAGLGKLERLELWHSASPTTA